MISALSPHLRLTISAKVLKITDTGDSDEQHWKPQFCLDIVFRLLCRVYRSLVEKTLNDSQKTWILAGHCNSFVLHLLRMRICPSVFFMLFLVSILLLCEVLN